MGKVQVIDTRIPNKENEYKLESSAISFFLCIIDAM